MAMEALRIAAKESRFMKFILGGFIFFAVGGLVFTDVGGYFTGGARGTTVAEVGDIKIDIREFDRGFRSFASQSDLTVEEAYQLGLGKVYLNARVNAALAQHASQDLNIRLSDEEIAKQLKSLFGDRSRDEIEMIMRAQGLSEQGLTQSIQADMTANIMTDLPKAVTNYVPQYVSDVEKRINAEQRSGIIYTIPADKLADDITLSDDDLRAYYINNPDEFTVMEERVFSVGSMTIDMAKANLPEITDADIRAEYEATIDDYVVPEKRSIIQVNVKNPDQAQAIYELGLEGTNLKEAIIEVTGDDNGHRDAAEFDANSLPAELSDIAFGNNVKSGDVLPPVKTLLGYVVMRVTDTQQEYTKPFGDIKSDLKKEMQDTQIFDALYTKMIDSEDMLDSGADFATIAEKTSLKIEETQSLTQSSLPNSDNSDLQLALENSPSVANEIFALQTGQATYPIELNDEKYIVIGVKDIKQSDLLPFEDVRTDIEKILRSNQTMTMAINKANAVVTKLNQGDLDVDTLKKDYDATAKPFKSIGRNDGKLNTNVIFNLSKDQYQVHQQNDQNIEIYTLNTIEFADESDISYDNLKDRQDRQVNALLNQYWQSNTSVSINESLLEFHYGDSESE
jgi:peptidyl-prolyl cis-trans isomerase D